MKKVQFEIKIDEKLSLVLPDPICANEIFALIDKDREHLKPWLPWVDSTVTANDTYKNLCERIEKFRNTEQASFYGTLNGEFAASVGFISLKDGEGEIGYWLLSQYCGKGLMTRFVEACIKYGFDKLNLDRIVIKCDEKNIKSGAIPKRLGFTQVEKPEGKSIRNGSEPNMIVFTRNRSS